jgi:hypothetical protein
MWSDRWYYKIRIIRTQAGCGYGYRLNLPTSTEVSAVNVIMLPASHRHFFRVIGVFNTIATEREALVRSSICGSPAVYSIHCRPGGISALTDSSSHELRRAVRCGKAPPIFGLTKAPQEVVTPAD